MTKLYEGMLFSDVSFKPTLENGDGASDNLVNGLLSLVFLCCNNSFKIAAHKFVLAARCPSISKMLKEFDSKS